MAASIGLAMNPHITEERAVFTQLKPVRMSGAEGAEDASVFEDVKPAVRVRCRAGEAGPGAVPGSGPTASNVSQLLCRFQNKGEKLRLRL